MSESDSFSLTDKRILVTGASSGIGRQIAIACAEMGARLVISGRNGERLAETLAALDGEGHCAIAADLTVQEDIDRLANESGVVNGVAHAAGIAKLAPYRQISQRHMDLVFASNLFAPMLLTKGLLAKKHMADNGSILFISSIASHIGPMATGAYAASKAGLLGQMRTLAIEVAKQGIRANCIAPGYVRTPLLDRLSQSGGNLSELLSMGPLGVGEPEDIACAAVFYLSDASRWITRNYFVVDGGFTLPMDIYA